MFPFLVGPASQLRINGTDFLEDNLFAGLSLTGLKVSFADPAGYRLEGDALPSDPAIRPQKVDGYAWTKGPTIRVLTVDRPLPGRWVAEEENLA